MGNILSDNVKNAIPDRNQKASSFHIISSVTLLDLGIIIPAVAIFLAYNVKSIASLNLLGSILIFSFVLYLPVAILFAGKFLGKKLYDSSSETDEILSVTLFFLLLFSMLGIYLPSMEKLSAMIPSFQMLGIVGGVVVILNLFLLLRNGEKIFREF